MSKMWTVSKVDYFNPQAPGQYYRKVEDLGLFPTKAAAEKAARDVMAEDDWWIFGSDDEMAVYKRQNQEVVLESIYVAE